MSHIFQKGKLFDARLNAEGVWGLLRAYLRYFCVYQVGNFFHLCLLHFANFPINFIRWVLHIYLPNSNQVVYFLYWWWNFCRISLRQFLSRWVLLDSGLNMTMVSCLREDTWTLFFRNEVLNYYFSWSLMFFLLTFIISNWNLCKVARSRLMKLKSTL